MSAILAVPAGRSIRRQGTNWVDPQPDKGLIELRLEDDLLHFSWVNRTTAQRDDDLIIFPGEATFEKVSQDTTGRTHILKFSSSDQKHFFWFQSRSTTGDQRAAVDINHLLQDQYYHPGTAPIPSTESAVETAAAAPAPAPADSEPRFLPVGTNEFDRILGSMFGGAAPQTTQTTQTTRATTTAQEPVEPSSNAQSNATQEAPAAGPSTGAAASNPQNFDAMVRLLAQEAGRAGGIGHVDDEIRLADVLSPGNIAHFALGNRAIVDKLYPLLPEGLDVPEHHDPTVEDLFPVLTAPQFTEAVNSLEEALRSGGLPASVLAELGLPESAGQSVRAFLEALRGLKKDENPYIRPEEEDYGDMTQD